MLLDLIYKYRLSIYGFQFEKRIELEIAMFTYKITKSCLHVCNWT